MMTVCWVMGNGKTTFECLAAKQDGQFFEIQLAEELLLARAHVSPRITDQSGSP